MGFTLLNRVPLGKFNRVKVDIAGYLQNIVVCINQKSLDLDISPRLTYTPLLKREDFFIL